MSVLTVIFATKKKKKKELQSLKEKKCDVINVFFEIHFYPLMQRIASEGPFVHASLSYCQGLHYWVCY